MENQVSKTEVRLIRWFATSIVLGATVAFPLGRCTAPKPAPEVFTKVNYVEVEKVVTEFLNTNSERECMAQALYAESRGEPKEGSRLVKAVINNRKADPRYPDTVCGVVGYKNKGVYHFSYQNKADPNFYETARVFSDMHTTYAERKSRRIAYEVADEPVAANPALPSNSLNYHSTSVQPDWASNLKKHAQVGAHIFYVGY